MLDIFISLRKIPDPILPYMFHYNKLCRNSIRRLELEELLAATRGLHPIAQTSGSSSQQQQQHGSPYNLIQLTRLNLPIEDTNEAQEAASNTPVLASYDIIAVQPHSERAFAFACTSLDVDIISIDLSKRLNYRFRPDLIKTAMQRGLHFEILYAPILRDSGSRRQSFANAQALSRETRGRAIILSSGARTALELRGPYDVVNLGTFLGLSEAQAHAAVGKNCTAVVEHARKRKAFRGTLTLRVSDSYSYLCTIIPNSLIIWYVYLQAFKVGTDEETLRASEAQPMETSDQPLTFARSAHVT